MKVVLLMALTVDGMIARDSYHFPDWTSRQDKAMFKQVTQKAGVVVMGSRTYDAIGKPLPGRKNIVLTRNKQRRSSHQDLVFTDSEPGVLLTDTAHMRYPWYHTEDDTPDKLDYERMAEIVRGLHAIALDRDVAEIRHDLSRRGDGDRRGRAP